MKNSAFMRTELSCFYFNCWLNWAVLVVQTLKIATLFGYYLSKKLAAFLLHSLMMCNFLFM